MELKNKTIMDLTTSELRELRARLDLERNVERRIMEYIRRSSDEEYDYENPPKVDTKTQIGEMYKTHSDFSNKTIEELSMEELRKLDHRIQLEEEVAYTIRELRRNSGEKVDYDNPSKIDNSTPISQLYHHGIPGMKWGVRRYQNEDGTLTDKGRRRLSSVENASKKGSKILDEASKIGTKTSKSKTIRKDYSDMTDAELQKRIQRLSLEENYGRLTGDTKKVRSGSEWAREILQTSAIAVGMAGSAVGIYLALKK